MPRSAINTKIRIIVSVTLVTACVFGIVIFSLLKKNQEALNKVKISDKIMLQVFERRLLADEYATGQTVRARSQWLTKQAELEELVRSNETQFQTPKEAALLGRINAAMSESKNVFGSLVTLYEETASTSEDQFLREKSERLSSLLSVKSQETIAAAATLKQINDKNATITFSQILTIFTILGGIFLVLLATSSREIWRSTNTLERKKSESDAILGGIGDGVFAINKEGQIILFNNAARELSGFATEEAVGRNYYEVLKFIDQKTQLRKTEFIDIALSGQKTVMPGETVLTTKSGVSIPVADSAAPIIDAAGSIVGAVVVFRDITAELELERTREEFVSLASHQLRTPLSAIKGFAQLLLEQKVGKLNQKQNEYLTEINDSNTRMMDLVDALLNVSRIDLGVFAIEPIYLNFCEIAENILSELQLKINEKYIQLDKVCDPTLPSIMADPKLIGIIFQNLLSNAVKYTPAGGKIHLAITKEGENVSIIVSDTGLGIPRAQQTKIFQRLFRADNARQAENEGTGLGLYIVRAIIEEAHGTIRFESEENKGTTFYITLPLSGMKKRDGAKGLSGDAS